MRYKRLSDGVVMSEFDFVSKCHNRDDRGCVSCSNCAIGGLVNHYSCRGYMEKHPVLCAYKLGFEPIRESDEDEGKMSQFYQELQKQCREEKIKEDLEVVKQWLEERGNQVTQADGMNQERFEALVQEIREKSMDTLLKKNANYGSADKLHNFRRGAAIIGCTPAQAALGYMTKHMASLIDKIQNNDFRDRDDFLEKIQDSINYLVFIWCCGNEERDKQEVSND